MPALAAAYVMWPATGRCAVVEDTLINEPPPVAAMAFPVWRMKYMAPLNWTSTIGAMMSGVRSRMDTDSWKPA